MKKGLACFRVLLSLALWAWPAAAHADESRRVHVTFAGALPPGLEARLRAPLERRGFVVVWRGQRTLSRRDLTQTISIEPSTTWVWVDAQRPERVQIVFGDAKLERYLVRSLPLATGLDELGQESIAQIVELSVDVLSRDQAGISREAMLRAVRPEVLAPPTSDRPKASAESSPSLRASVGAMYALRAFSSEVPVSHGPGLALGVRGVRREVNLTATAEYHLPFELSSEPVGARFTRIPLRATLGYALISSSAAAIQLSLGAGADALWIEPKRALDDATLGKSGWLLAPVLMLGLPARLRAAGVDFWVAPACDVALRRTHFDVDEGGSRRRLSTLFAFRPAFWLGMSVTVPG